MLVWQNGQVNFKFGQGSGRIETTIVLLINNQVFSTVISSKADLDKYFGKKPAQSIFANDLLKCFPDDANSIGQLTVMLHTQVFMGIDDL